MNYEISFDPSLFFAQIGGVFGGLFLLLAGMAIVYTIADWWLLGLRVEGVVVGVRRLGPQIYSVFSYVLPGGAVREATSIQGGNSLKGRETGRKVTIRVMANKPEEAREAPGIAMWSLALSLSLGGTWLVYAAVASRHHIIFTWVFVAVIALYVGRKIQRLLARWWNTSQPQPADPWSSMPIEAAEDLGRVPQPNRIRVSGNAPGRSSVILFLAGVVVLTTAAFQVRRLMQLEHGTKTQGTVCRLHANMDSKNHSIYPDVEFTNVQGSAVQFTDKVGENPSPFRVGDHVTVLYLPAEAGTAMIDYGWHNWESVCSLGLLGSILMSLGLFTFRSLLSSSGK